MSAYGMRQHDCRRHADLETAMQEQFAVAVFGHEVAAACVDRPISGLELGTSNDHWPEAKPVEALPGGGRE